MTTKANRIIRYYDTHELEGAELTESRLHREIISYLTLVIKWIFNARNIGVTGNTNFYQTSSPKEPSISPDITVVGGFVTDRSKIERTPSYHIGEDGPPPLVVLEIASEATWRADLENKPAKYEAMGVQEYFVFDPNTRTLWTGQWRGFNRLIGWRRNGATGRFEMLEKDGDDRLWSEELESWLAVEGNDLQLYTANGQLRITEAEAATQKAQRLAEKLRRLGIDPEE